MTNKVDLIETIEKLTKELLTLAGVDVTVKVEENEEGNYEGNLETTEEKGILIFFIF